MGIVENFTVTGKGLVLSKREDGYAAESSFTISALLAEAPFNNLVAPWNGEQRRERGRLSLCHCYSYFSDPP